MSHLTQKAIISEFHHPYEGKLGEFLERRIFASNNVIKCVVITKKLKGYYVEKYPKKKNKIIVLPDAADPPNGNYKYTYKGFNCGYVGSFYEGKGIETVLELALELPEINFHIVGGTNEKIKSIKEEYDFDNIIFYGYVNQKKVFEIMNCLDIVLLPNKNKVYIESSSVDIGKWTSPMKMFEYMSMGKAIIASDLPVLKEVLKNNYNSILVNPYSIEDWIYAIKDLRRNEKKRIDIGLNAKKDFVNKYTWGKRVEKLVKSLKENNEVIK